MNAIQRGTTTVEFAIVILVTLLAAIGIIEIGRLTFTSNTLTESTRRGARMAVVCPVGDPAPAQVAVFSGSATPILKGLTTAHIRTEYLDEAGAVIANAAGAQDTIRYVRVSVTGYTLSLLIPTALTTVTLHPASTTLPRESLGVSRTGVTTAC